VQTEKTIFVVSLFQIHRNAILHILVRGYDAALIMPEFDLILYSIGFNIFRTLNNHMYVFNFESRRPLVVYLKYAVLMIDGCLTKTRKCPVCGNEKRYFRYGLKHCCEL